MRLVVKKSFFFICIAFMCTVAYGQESNPFELEHKISKASKWESVEEINLPELQKIIDTSGNPAAELVDPVFQTEAIEGNPFEIDGTSRRVLEATVDPIKTAPIAAVGAKSQRVSVTSSIKALIDQFKMVMSVILLISLALISTLLRHVIIRVFEGFRSDNLLRSYFRSTGRRMSLPNILLEVFFVLNAAFTCFLLAEHFDLLQGQPVLEYLKLLAVVSTVVFGKHVILFIIREVFPISKEVAEYNFTINVFLSILGLILLPCNLILGFADGGMAILMLYFIGLTVALMLGYLTFRALIIGSKFLSSNRFHFFMYLCTVEIAPLFILVKVVKNYLGS